MRWSTKSLKPVRILFFLRDFSRDWCFVHVRLSFDMKTIIFVQIFTYFSKILSKIKNFKPKALKKWIKGNINAQIRICVPNQDVSVYFTFDPLFEGCRLEIFDF